MRFQPEPDEDPLAEFDYALLLAEADEQFIDKYYIHPDSLHLLEPQVGDLCMTIDGVVALCEGPIMELEIGTNRRCVILFGGAYEELSRIARIIQRNGIPFHWPESEAV